MIGKNILISFVLSIFYFQEILCNSCNVNLRVSQNLTKPGFHRNLSYVLDFTSSNIPFGGCLVGLEQTLPSGVFISPDEIKWHKCKDLVEIIFKGPVNIEHPAEYAQPIKIHVIGKIRNGHSEIYLPVHARYQSARKGGGMALNVIGKPTLFVSCPSKQIYECRFGFNSTTNSFCPKKTKEKCRWMQVPSTMVTRAKLTWDVPVGNIDHRDIVFWVTLAATVLSSLYLLKTLHDYKRSGTIKRKVT